jgi:pilus assembly protein CpaC
MRLRMVLFALAALAALATPPASAAGVVEDRGTLRATVGGGQVLTFSSPVHRIAVADDTLASVHLVSEREVLLNGVKPGVTTLFIWLEDDRRVRYVLRVGPNIDYVAQALRDIDPRISVETSPDGSSIVLRGDVADARTARVAKEQAMLLLGSGRNSSVGTILNLLRYPGMTATAEDRIAALLDGVDPRIRVRRIQVGAEPNVERDSFVLEGNVKSIADLERAVALAERQLGGTGIRLKVADDNRIQSNRNRNFSGGGGGVGGRGLQSLGGSNALSSSLASQISRGLVVTSESGRVISFLEVDQIEQVMVSIRVLEVDRGKARKMGVNFRIDSEHVSLGNYVGPQSSNMPGQYGGRPDVSVLGGGVTGPNLVGAFVDQVQSILTAIDFLDSKNLVRSVAEPNILTLSGEEATVLVGGEVPIPTATANSVSTFRGVFFQDFGVRLDIRPTVDRDGVVTLEVAPSIIRPDGGLTVAEVPGFSVQTVQTTARVDAGETLVLGGLLSFQESVDQHGLPGLQRIPLFRWKYRTHAEKELLFVITPRLVGYGSDAAREAQVGPLDWPEDRGEWIDNLPAPEYSEDGIPPSFVPAPEPAVVTPTPAPVPAPVYYQPAPVQPAPAPAPEPTEPPPAESHAASVSSPSRPEAATSSERDRLASAYPAPAEVHSVAVEPEPTAVATSNPIESSELADTAAAPEPASSAVAEDSVATMPAEASPIATTTSAALEPASNPAVISAAPQMAATPATAAPTEATQKKPVPLQWVPLDDSASTPPDNGF